jgi:hypothetical protein
MKSGYKIQWTNKATRELVATFDSLKENWSNKELTRLARELEITRNWFQIILTYFKRQIKKMCGELSS